MFLGAAGMTAIVLLLLIWLLPDLPMRTKWLLASLHQERLRVEGILNVPGHGPVVLATNAASDYDRINVRWACDRRVHFVPNLASEGDVQQGLDNLRAERVVAITVNESTAAKAEEFLNAAVKQLGPELVVLPAEAEKSVVKFGEPQTEPASAATLIASIRTIGRRQVEE
jgi:hypothetical protein